MADINFNSAVNAYNKALKMSGESASETSSSGSSDGGMGVSFDDLLKHTLEDARDTGYKSEVSSAKSMTSKSDLNDLVTSVTNAELTLKTVVAVRDKVISAYQEVLKMPI